MEGYKECFVAFIDILGFRRLIDKADFEEIKKIFDEILSFEAHPLVKKKELYKHIKIHVMSDSIIIYIEKRYKDAFIALNAVCAQIQIKLSSNNPPILVRGGIAFGKIYHHRNVIFGDGLTKAYLLESSLAKYPRIVFTEETRQIALGNMDRMYVLDFNKMYYKQDKDKLYYVDYMNTFCYLPSLGDLSHDKIENFDNRYFDELLSYTEDNLGKCTDAAIREKYLWLNDKLVQGIECRPQVEKYFEEKERAEQEKRVKRYDAALKGKSKGCN